MEKKSRTNKGVLCGKVVSVSSFNNENKKEQTYEELKKQVENTGASVTGIVHKKVFVLVATDQAFEQKTQRVRKALKFNIPLVKPSWIQACAKSGSIVDRNDKKHSHPILPQKDKDDCDDNDSNIRKTKKRRNDDGENDDDSTNQTNEIDSLNNKKKAKKKEKKKEEEIIQAGDDDKEEEISKFAVWEQKIELGCCCSCHDENKPFCEWCKESHCTSENDNDNDSKEEAEKVNKTKKKAKKTKEKKKK